MKLNQTELTGSEEVFNLAAEQTGDGEKIKQQREQAERDRKEAAEIEAKLQPLLL